MALRTRLELIFLALGHGVTHWYATGFFLIVPFIQADYNLSFAEAGLLVAYRTFIGAVANLPSGAVTDWLGRRRLILIVSIVWSALIYLAVGLTENYYALQVFVALVGIGAATWHPAAISTLSERLPKRKGFALSIHELGANLGDALSPLVIGALLAVVSWRVVLAINFLPGILLAILVGLFVVDPGPREGGRPRFSTYAVTALGLLRNPVMLRLSGVSALRSMSQNILQTFLPIYLLTGLGLGPATAGIYVSLLTLPSLISGILLGTVSDRTGRRAIMMLCLGVSGITVTLLTPLREGVFFGAALIVTGLFLFSVRPVLFAQAMDITKAQVGGTTVSFLFGINMLFSSLAPWLAGWVADQTSLGATFYLAGGCILASLVLALGLPAGRPSDSARPHGKDETDGTLAAPHDPRRESPQAEMAR